MVTWYVLHAGQAQQVGQQHMIILVAGLWTGT